MQPAIDECAIPPPGPAGVAIVATSFAPCALFITADMTGWAVTAGARLTAWLPCRVAGVEPFAPVIS